MPSRNATPFLYGYLFFKASFHHHFAIVVGLSQGSLDDVETASETGCWDGCRGGTGNEFSVCSIDADPFGFKSPHLGLAGLGIVRHLYLAVSGFHFVKRSNETGKENHFLYVFHGRTT